jgi:hypothetical protein
MHPEKNMLPMESNLGQANILHYHWTIKANTDSVHEGVHCDKVTAWGKIYELIKVFRKE